MNRRASAKVILIQLPSHKSEGKLTLTLLLLAVAVVAIWNIANRAAECSGSDVAKRFLEVTPDYTADGLRNWIVTHRSEATRYAFPVLFPIDLLFLVALSALLAFASVAIANALHWGEEWIRFLTIFPILYAACDFIENVLLARFMVFATAVTNGSVALARTFTGLKFVTLAISVLQLLVMLACGLARILVNALR
jgi:hypothetical protein